MVWFRCGFSCLLESMAMRLTSIEHANEINLLGWTGDGLFLIKMSESVTHWNSVQDFSHENKKIEISHQQYKILQNYWCFLKSIIEVQFPQRGSKIARLNSSISWLQLLFVVSTKSLASIATSIEPRARRPAFPFKAFAILGLPLYSSTRWRLVSSRYWSTNKFHPAGSAFRNSVTASGSSVAKYMLAIGVIDFDGSSLLPRWCRILLTASI